MFLVFDDDKAYDQSYHKIVKKKYTIKNSFKKDEMDMSFTTELILLYHFRPERENKTTKTFKMLFKNCN